MNKATDHDGRVARDAVWTEYIGKELMTMKLRTEFTVNTDESKGIHYSSVYSR